VVLDKEKDKLLHSDKAVRFVEDQVTFKSFKLLHRNVQRFRGGLVFKAHRLLYHSTLGSRVIKKKKKRSFRFCFLPR